MDDDERYLEQYCQDCREETDHRADPTLVMATCLACGATTTVTSEDERLGALVQRLQEDDASLLRRVRAAPVPLI